MRKAVLIIVSVLLGLTSEAQFNQDYGVIVGVATHRGDINSTGGFFGGSAASPTIGGYYRYKFSSLISARGQLQWARLTGDDKNADEVARQVRNLNFRTTLIEIAAIGEVHILDIKDFGSTGRYNVFFNVYGFAGVAMTYYNPQGQRPSNDEWVDLRPLQTEGEKYSSWTPAFPIGVGAHFTFNRKWRLGAELGYRFTLTDYLDDVSGNYLTTAEYESGDPLTYEMAVKVDQDLANQNPDLFPQPYPGAGGGVRGGPDANDSYFFGTVNVGFLIRGKSNFYRAKYQYSRGRGKKRRRQRAKF